jgi:hypothetical protein
MAILILTPDTISKSSAPTPKMSARLVDRSANHMPCACTDALATSTVASAMNPRVTLKLRMFFSKENAGDQMTASAFILTIPTKIG